MFLKAGIASLALLLASRVLGLVRESAVAAAFGATGWGDVAVFLFALPDWLAGVLASGALAYVLLPDWARAEGRVGARQRRVARYLLELGVAFGLLFVAFGDRVIRVLAAGVPPALEGPAANALAWSAAGVPLALLAALWSTRLQHEKDFLGLYAASLVVNLALIALLAFVALQPGPLPPGPVLGLGIVAAMALRLVWLLARLRRVPRSIAEPPGPAADAALPRLPLWLWAGLAAGLPLALPFAARSIASTGGEGVLATFNYAWKLVELPLMLAIQLVATLALPAVARAMAQAAPNPDTGVPREAVDAARAAFGLAWALACAAAAGLLVASDAVANLLFGWGRMQADALATIAGWGRVAAWGLLPQALIAVGLTVAASQSRMRTAVVAYGLALVVLLAAGMGGWRDGGDLMRLLNLLFTGVATAVIVAIGPVARQMLPWRGMMPAFGGVLVVAFVPLPALGLPVQLALAVAAAGLVLAMAVVADPGLRRAVRR